MKINSCMGTSENIFIFSMTQGQNDKKTWCLWNSESQVWHVKTSNLDEIVMQVGINIGSLNKDKHMVKISRDGVVIGQ